jgi:hypothetical protein
MVLQTINVNVNNNNQIFIIIYAGLYLYGDYIYMGIIFIQGYHTGVSYNGIIQGYHKGYHTGGIIKGIFT